VLSQLLLFSEPAQNLPDRSWGLKGFVAKRPSCLKKPLFGLQLLLGMCPSLCSGPCTLWLADREAEAADPETKGDVGGRVGEREKGVGWGIAAPPSFIVASLGNRLCGASTASSPFKGRFSSRLVNYAGPASGRDRERQRGKENQRPPPWMPGNSPRQSMPCSTASWASLRAKWGVFGVVTEPVAAWIRTSSPRFRSAAS
jgi:hypothetical protein